MTQVICTKCQGKGIECIVQTIRNGVSFEPSWGFEFVGARSIGGGLLLADFERKCRICNGSGVVQSPQN